MSENFRYPNITAGTEAQQIAQIKSYLHQLVDQLNWAYGRQETGGAGRNNPNGVKSEEYNELRSIMAVLRVDMDKKLGQFVSDSELSEALGDYAKTINGVSPDENGNVNVAGAGMVVAVTDNVSSKTSAEIVAHVKTGGSVVLKRGEDLYNFVNYSEDTSGACFMMVDPMDGEYLETATVDGNRVTFYKLPFALKSEVVKTVNGVSPDENGNVDVASMIVTVTGTTASHSSSEIVSHVKAGGTAVLKLGENLYNFVNYSEDADAACFIEVDAMDGEYFQMATVSGNRVYFHKLPFALDREVVKTINGVEPDKNGNVELTIPTTVNGSGTTNFASLVGNHYGATMDIIHQNIGSYDNNSVNTFIASGSGPVFCATLLKESNEYFACTLFNYQDGWLVLFRYNNGTYYGAIFH